jgi:hypothetical protein
MMRIRRSVRISAVRTDDDVRRREKKITIMSRIHLPERFKAQQAIQVNRVWDRRRRP